MLVARLTIAAILAAIGASWRPLEYPAYCSKDMSQYAIPALAEDVIATHNPTLKQVQVMIRHGARTPYAKMFCWDNYDVPWNCNVTELMAPSPTNKGNAAPIWLFRKLYDGSPNYLGGDCFTGQLISEGYEQEEVNGENLKAAYIGEGKRYLFDTDRYEDLDQKSMYFRADDAQRVLMSAQILLHSMFTVDETTIVPFHLGDYNLDSMYPNDRVCPRLDDLEDEAYASEGWKAGNNSADAKAMTAALTDILGKGWSWYNLIDCFMTTVCTDHDIPEGMTEELFQDAVDHAEWQYAYPAQYNNQIWSKYALGHITRDIRTRMQAKIDDAADAFKFVIYSGHDTTIMPFLSALGVWDGEWASYASIVTMELWEAENGDHYTRMAYNGKELILPGCDEAFCKSDAFMDATAFAVEDMDCSAEEKKEKKKKSDDDDDELSEATWTLIVVLSTIGGVLLGSLAMFFVMRGQRPQGSDEEYGRLNA